MYTTILSVDFDDLACYAAIHGLSGLEAQTADGEKDADPVYARWLPRLLETLDAVKGSAKATLFVIGRGLERDLDGSGAGASLLRQARADGHELGNHSYAHDYRMSGWAAADIQKDIQRADRVLETVGARALGFRAPGYTMSERLATQISASGFLYDSSVLPSPLYYLTKLAVMGTMRLRGRRSKSSWAGARGFMSRSLPHVRANGGMWEIPISVTPGTRLPYIGSTLFATTDAVFSRLMRASESAPFLHIGLHALDFADPQADGLPPEFVALQPELRRDVSTRRRRIQELLELRGGCQSIASMLPIPQTSHANWDQRAQASVDAEDEAGEDDPAETSETEDDPVDTAPETSDSAVG